MELTELQGLCTEWQVILRMRDWRIRVAFVDSLPDDQAVGFIDFKADTKDAEIQILAPAVYAAGKRSISGYDPEQILVHEMLHAALNDDCKDNTIMEHAVDCLADALVNLRRK